VIGLLGGIEALKCDFEECSQEATVAYRELMNNNSLRISSSWFPTNNVWWFCAAHEDRGAARLADEDKRVTRVTLGEAENLRRLGKTAG
jgi:hypothetical protein